MIYDMEKSKPEIMQACYTQWDNCINIIAEKNKRIPVLWRRGLRD